MLRANFREHRRGIVDPMTGGTIDRGIDMTIEPMRHARFLLRRRPRGDDAQIAVDLHGIGIDDDAAGSFSKRQRQRRLAAGGRPCDKQGLACRLPALFLACLLKRIAAHVSRRHADLPSRQSRAR